MSERRALQRAVSAKENAFFNSAAFHKASSIIYRFQEKLEASAVHVGLCMTFQIIEATFSTINEARALHTVLIAVDLLDCLFI